MALIPLVCVCVCVCVPAADFGKVGAGISTAAGIPDFRTPGTGLYSNLARLNLPYPEAVFDISYFKNDPKPFYMLADELFPSKFTPTRFHAFMRLVHTKGALRRVFTQNIDTLERIAGVPGDKVVEAHGSFAGNHCVDCKAEMSAVDLKKAMYPNGGTRVAEGQKVGIPRCQNPRCKTPAGGLVKPDIVFFGEGLPLRFFDLAEEDLPVADLVIVAGTSLTVRPFASLPEDVGPGTPRVLFNLEAVGDLGERAGDVVALGSCDAEVQRFAALCGWGKDLERLYQEIVGDSRAGGDQASKSEKQKDDEIPTDEPLEAGDKEGDKEGRVPADNEGETETGKDDTAAVVEDKKAAASSAGDNENSDKNAIKKDGKPELVEDKAVDEIAKAVASKLSL